MRSAKADLTPAPACSAPSTVRDPIVANASSGLSALVSGGLLCVVAVTAIGATTPAERQLARNWLLRIDLAEYGSEEAEKRRKARDADYFSRCVRFVRVDPMTGKREIVVREGVDRSDCDDQRPEPK